MPMLWTLTIQQEREVMRTAVARKSGAFVSGKRVAQSGDTKKGFAVQIEEFITRWKQSGGSERANFQTFAYELCDILDVPRPAPASERSTAQAGVVAEL